MKRFISYFNAFKFLSLKINNDFKLCCLLYKSESVNDFNYVTDITE